MSFYVATLLLLPAGILYGSFIPRVNAAPTTYDQRQSGDFNVDAKLDNFLVVVATSASGNLFSNLATQALELSDLVGARSKTREKPTEAMVYESEDADGGRGPYQVEIVRIEKEGDSKYPEKSPDAEIDEEIKLVSPFEPADNSDKVSRQTIDPVVSTDSKSVEKKARSLWNSKGRGFVDSSIGESKRAVKLKNLQVESLDRSDDLSAKEVTVKAARPGISLKKQLSKKEERDPSSISQERNELGNKYQELVLIGDGIENCGPGRYRDKLGVCQNDADFD